MVPIILLFVIMLFLTMMSVPIVYSIGIASGFILILQGGFDGCLLLPSRMFKGIDSFVLVAVPFFILTSEFLARGGLMKRLVSFSEKLIGHVRGGLLQVNILTSMIFAGIQASATADSSAIGSLLIPMTIKNGYDRDIAAVVTATSSICGPIIPPSIAMIFYSFLTGNSVAKLFLGGAIPGILLGISLMFITDYWVVRRGYKKSRNKRASLKEIGKSGLQALPGIFIGLVIVVGIVGGIVTPAEAGIIASLSALIVATLFYRELSVSEIVASFKSTAYTVTSVFCIISTATVFSEVLVRNLFVDKIINMISMNFSNPTHILILISIIIFFLGMVIDDFPLLLIVASPLNSLGISMGIDPIHLGVVLVMSALIASVSPPVAVLLCLDCKIAKIPLSATFSIIWSYLLVMLGVVILCILIPSLVTWLPNLLIK